MARSPCGPQRASCGSPTAKARAAVAAIGTSGFVDRWLDGEPWRVYYLRPRRRHVGRWRSGRRPTSATKSSRACSLGQFLPWVLMLPVLLVAMAVVVRHALQPVRAAGRATSARAAPTTSIRVAVSRPAGGVGAAGAGDRTGCSTASGSTLEHERRLTADAAHELRTPLAALRAQWEAMRVAGDDATRERGVPPGRRGHRPALARLVRNCSRCPASTTAPATHFTAMVDWRRVGAGRALRLPAADRVQRAAKWRSSGRRGRRTGDAAHRRRGADRPAAAQPGRQRVALRATAVPGAVRLTPEMLVVEDDGPGLQPTRAGAAGRPLLPPGRAGGRRQRARRVDRAARGRAARPHGALRQSRRPPATGLRVDGDAHGLARSAAAITSPRARAFVEQHLRLVAPAGVGELAARAARARRARARGRRPRRAGLPVSTRYSP